MRLFAALPFSESAQTQLNQFALSIAPLFERARPVWVPWQNFHITLHFFGELDPQTAAELQYRMREPAALCTPLRISTGKLSVLPSFRSPRVLIIETRILPEKKGVALVQNLRNIAAQIKAETDFRPWNAHLTLARFKEPWIPDVSTLPAPPNISFEVPAVALMRSTLSPHGAEYSCIYTVSFGGAIDFASR